MKDNCDVCLRPILHTCVDAPMKNGQWAVMCPACRIDHARSMELGIGKGQKYERPTRSAPWRKTMG